MPRDTLVKAAGYDDMSKLYETMDTYWLGDIYEYYSHKPEWEKKRQEERQEALKRMQQVREEVRKVSPPPQSTTNNQ